MHFLSQMLQVCYFSILIKLLNGYLLFAANLDDFHAIAKKLVPDRLAATLTQIASKPSIRERQDSNEDEDSDDSFDNDYDEHRPLKGRKEVNKTKEKFVLNRDTKVNFDELVERVRKRLSIEIKQKLLDKINMKNKTANVNDNKKRFNKNIVTQSLKGGMTDSTIEYNKEEMSPFEDQPDYKEDIFNKPKTKQNIKTVTTEAQHYDYADAMETIPLTDYKKPTREKYLNKPIKNNEKYSQEIISTTENVLYEKVVMTHKDSYEDYIVQAKGDKVYSSSEMKPVKFVPVNKRYKIETNLPSSHKKHDNKRDKIVKYTAGDNDHRIENVKSTLKVTFDDNYENAEKLIDSKEIKAKTENLSYDPDRFTDTLILTESSKKSKYGTRLPTKQTYKMITPNYNAKLPIIAEKYNFDEPIPERDRERESISYIGNPPASINKKVRLI